MKRGGMRLTPCGRSHQPLVWLILSPGVRGYPQLGSSLMITVDENRGLLKPPRNLRAELVKTTKPLAESKLWGREKVDASCYATQKEASVATAE